MLLPISVNDLLKGHAIETDRVEFKSGWNPDAIYRTICAFANDFENIGGGYLLVGVSEEEGRAKRPVAGLTAPTIALIEQQMIGFNRLIDPPYHPKLFIEEVDEKFIIVIWAPGSVDRPHKCPEQITSSDKRYQYFIRQYASSVRPSLRQEQELVSLADQVPFDDRPNHSSTTANIDLLLVRDFLRRTKSRLSDQAEVLEKKDLLSQLLLLDGPTEFLRPRNVALLLFSENPSLFFPYCFIDLVHFPGGEAASHFSELKFAGPVDQQIRHALTYLQTQIVRELVFKVPEKAEAIRAWNYPFRALEEVIANAVFHRDYQVREPIEIRVYEKSIVVLNFGGPDRSINWESLTQGTVRARRYRNRRLGDFLKELDLTEGRATGLPIIQKALKDNGSPPARLETDQERTYFLIELFRHELFDRTSNEISRFDSQKPFLQPDAPDAQRTNSNTGDFVEGERGKTSDIHSFILR